MEFLAKKISVKNTGKKIVMDRFYAHNSVTYIKNPVKHYIY